MEEKMGDQQTYYFNNINLKLYDKFMITSKAILE